MFQSLLPRVKKKLVVGQDVDINGGFGRTTCKVVKIEPPCIYVEINGLYRFNSEGKECAPDGRAYHNPSNGVDPGPYELVGGPWELTDVE